MKMIEKDLSGVEITLRNILQDYSLDFVKHATPLLANRISHVWKSLPSQLAKEIESLFISWFVLVQERGNMRMLLHGLKMRD